jgi:hypothetical protein
MRTNLTSILFILLSKTLNTCVAGQFTNSGASDACAPCTAGTFSTATSALTSTTACTNCAAGTFSAAGATECTTCAAGKKAAAAATECTDCDANTASKAGSETCAADCDAGYKKDGLTCLPCAAGT